MAWPTIWTGQQSVQGDAPSRERRRACPWSHPLKNGFAIQGFQFASQKRPE